MQDFIPQKILVEKTVAALPLTQRVLAKFPRVLVEEVTQWQDWKEPGPMTEAKRLLAIVEQKGKPVKPFPKIKDAINLGDYVFNPISNCHLECSYCILQSYLKNNPVLTLFANTEDFLKSIRSVVALHAGKPLRLGTGELSDSLALDPVTEFSKTWVPFFSELENTFLELKTKSDCVENLLNLEHGGHTVISWSLSPAEIARREELKCASITERLAAAARVQAAGYPVGLHLDPMIYFEDWESGYEDLIAEMAAKLDPKHIAWVSVGSLRFDKPLKDIATQRFPQTTIFAQDFIAAPDGKMRYFKNIRCRMYQKVWDLLREWSEDFPRYLCMEPAWMWEAVAGGAPCAESVEEKLTRRLLALADGIG